MANSRQLRRPPASLPGVTAEQMKVLRLFREYFDRNQVAPSLADLAVPLDISRPTVSRYLGRLANRGCLQPSPSRYRPWLLTAKGRRLAANATRFESVA